MEYDNYSKEEIDKMESMTDWDKVSSAKDEDIILDEDCPDMTELVAHGKAKTIRMGRPHKETPKELVSIRLDAHVLDTLRASGSGWETWLSEHIAEWARTL